MIEKRNLIDIQDEGFGRGWIFHCPEAEYPYEKKVEFMIREESESPCGYALMVSSGYKAGLTLVMLPKECLIPEHGISRKWLIDNWSTWVYPPCPVSKVQVYRNIISD